MSEDASPSAEQVFLDDLSVFPDSLRNTLGWMHPAKKDVYDLLSRTISRYGNVVWVWKGVLAFFPKGFPEDLLEFIQEIDYHLDKRDACYFLVNGYILRESYLGNLPAVYEDFLAFNILKEEGGFHLVEVKKDLPKHMWSYAREEVRSKLKHVEKLTFDGVLVKRGCIGYVARGTVKLRRLKKEVRWYLAGRIPPELQTRWDVALKRENPGDIVSTVIHDMFGYGHFKFWLNIMVRPEYEVLYEVFQREVLSGKIEEWGFLLRGKEILKTVFMALPMYYKSLDLAKFLSCVTPVYVHLPDKKHELYYAIAPFFFESTIVMKILKTVHACRANASSIVKVLNRYMMKKLLCVGDDISFYLARMFSFCLVR